MPKKNRGIHVAEREDRGTWGVLEYVKGKRVWHSSGHDSRGAAEVALARKILQAGKRETAEVTIGELMGYYLTVRAPRLARPDNALYFHSRLTEFWADKKLTDVTQGNIAAYMVSRNKSYEKWQKRDGHKTIKPITTAAIRREIEHLRACINLAETDRLIPQAPRIKLPEKGAAKERWLTRQEAAKLLREARKLRYAKTYLPHFIRIALRTGTRKGALLSLRWNQVDLVNQTIDFRPAQKSQMKGAAVAAIPDKQMPYFRALIRQGTKLTYVINKYGDQVARVDKSFAEACRNAGLEGVSIHTLRHTFASWLKQDGLSVSDIAEALGHRSTQMVDKVYGHMGAGYVDRLKKAVR